MAFPDTIFESIVSSDSVGGGEDYPSTYSIFRVELMSDWLTGLGDPSSLQLH